MKKPLLLAAAAVLLSAAAPVHAAKYFTAITSIPQDIAFKLKTNAQDLYLDMTQDPSVADDEKGCASVTATGTSLWLEVNPENAGQFCLRADPKGSGNVFAIDASHGWNTTKNTTEAFYWNLVGDFSFGEVSGGMTIPEQPYASFSSNKGLMGPNKNGLAALAAIYSNHANDNTNTIWRLIPQSGEFPKMTVNIKRNNSDSEPALVYYLYGKNGDTWTFPDPEDRYVIENPITVTFAANTTAEISLAGCVEKIPFKHTATTENLIWQPVGHHYNQHWIWKYTAENSSNLISKPSNRLNTNEPWSDEELWAFVGDYDHGFKIYNKAAGLSMTMYKDNDRVKVGPVTENNVWKFGASDADADASSDITQYCVFRLNGEGNPMNAQGNEILFNWDQADAGSTCMFYSVAEPMLNVYNGIEAELGLPAEVVGAATMPDEFKTSIIAAYNAADADPYSIDKAKALSEALTKYETEGTFTQFNPSYWYRLENVAAHNYWVSGREGGIKCDVANPAADYHTLLKFVPVEGADEGIYNILSQGMYVGKVTANSQAFTEVAATDTENIGNYRIDNAAGTHSKKGFCNVQRTDNPDYAYFHQTGSDVVAWELGNQHTQWYMHMVEDVEVALPATVENQHMALAYFPFPVKAAQGVKLYVINEATRKTDNEPVVTYKEVTNVPAETAFMILGETATATLPIDYDAIAVAADEAAPAEKPNLLSGTLRAASAQAGDYVYDAASTSFVKSADAPAIGGNSAWIPASALSDATRASYSLVNPGETSGIANIGVAEGGAKVIYDLQGRRVERAARGLYIINGVKTLVR